MSRIALQTITEADASQRTVIKQQMATSIVGPYEDSSMMCGNCGRTLVQGYSLQQFNQECLMGFNNSKFYAVFQCPRCNAYNDTTQ